MENGILENIKAGLNEAFPNSEKLELENENACNGQLGLKILVISDDFEGVKLLDRHR